MDSVTVDSTSLKTKEEYELQKLKLEVIKAHRDLELTRWWSRPEFISSLTPIILGVVGFLTAVLSGFFDQRKSVLNAEIELLRQEKQKLVASNEEVYIKMKTGLDMLQYWQKHQKQTIADLDKVTQKLKNGQTLDHTKDTIIGINEMIQYLGTADRFDTDIRSVLEKIQVSPEARKITWDPQSREIYTMDDKPYILTNGKEIPTEEGLLQKMRNKKLK